MIRQGMSRAYKIPTRLRIIFFIAFRTYLFKMVLPMKTAASRWETSWLKSKITSSTTGSTWTPRPSWNQSVSTVLTLFLWEEKAPKKKRSGRPAHQWIPHHHKKPVAPFPIPIRSKQKTETRRTTVPNTISHNVSIVEGFFLFFSICTNEHQERKYKLGRSAVSRGFCKRREMRILKDRIEWPIQRGLGRTEGLVIFFSYPSQRSANW